MAEDSRYRTEDGTPCIDVRARTIEQLFDNRDPAPFRQRDLDPDLAEYLLAAGDDLHHHDTFKVVFWMEQACDPAEIDAAVRAHFEYLIDRLRRARQRRRRTGQVTLVLAALVLVALITLSQVAAPAIGGSLGAAVREGLVISGWVLMWRPIEVLVYDWIPARRERKGA